MDDRTYLIESFLGSTHGGGSSNEINANLLIDRAIPVAEQRLMFTPARPTSKKKMGSQPKSH
jgi:hypothetical protein